MAWLLLIIAGLCEIVWAIGLKHTAGFTRVWPTVITLTAMLVSIVLLGIAMKSLPVGAVGTAVMGILVLGEPANAGRIASLTLIIAGIIGLKLATPA